MDWHKLLEMGLNEQGRVFRGWSVAHLLEQAQCIASMSDERDDMGFSERNVWAPALYRQAHLRLAHMQELLDHMQIVDTEWHCEWDDLEQVKTLVKDWAD